MLERASIIFAFALPLIPAAIAASVHVRALGNPPVPVARVTAGPNGTLICQDWRTHSATVIAPAGKQAGVELAIPASARVTDVGGGDGQTVVTTAQHGTYVLAADGSVRARFEPIRFQPYAAATTSGDAAFGMGSAGDANGRVRADWLVARVDVKNPSAAPTEIVSDEAFADPFRRTLYPLGYLLVSADRSTLYALWEGSPALYVIPIAGGSPRKIILTTGADAPVAATSALASFVVSDRNAFYQIRSRFRWPAGLLRGPGDSVAVLFREPASRGSTFTIDMYSRDGKKISSSLKVDLQPRSPTAHARTVTATDGRQYVVVNEPNSDYSGVKNQTLYAIDIVP